MSLRQTTLSLLCQRGDAMPEDSDSNVVKIVVGENGDIPLIVRRSMTEVTAGLGIEQLPAAFCRIFRSFATTSSGLLWPISIGLRIGSFA